jgi:hypothetical protein
MPSVRVTAALRKALLSALPALPSTTRVGLLGCIASAFRSSRLEEFSPTVGPPRNHLVLASRRWLSLSNGLFALKTTCSFCVFGQLNSLAASFNTVPLSAHINFIPYLTGSYGKLLATRCSELSHVCSNSVHASA